MDGKSKTVENLTDDSSTKHISRSSRSRSSSMILSSDDDMPIYGSQGSVHAKYKRLKKLSDSGTSSSAGPGKETDIVDDDAISNNSTDSDDEYASDNEVLATAIAKFKKQKSQK